MVDFDAPTALAWLEAASTQDLDALPFGVVRMQSGGVVVAYNTSESRLTGLSTEHVMQRNFFSNVAPCMNNYLVSERFYSEPELDLVMNYVFTLRMTPTAVTLRLLKSASALHMYLLVRR